MGIFSQIKTNIAVAKIIKEERGGTYSPSFGLEYEKAMSDYFDNMNKIRNKASVLHNLKITDGPQMDELIELCIQNILQFKTAKVHWKKNNMSVPERVPAFERLAIIYERQKKYDKTLEVCMAAIDEGCSKETYNARIARMIKKLHIEDISKYNAYL